MFGSDNQKLIYFFKRLRKFAIFKGSFDILAQYMEAVKAKAEDKRITIYDAIGF
jgi:hypothetical protein